jgi:hypothetical protein
MKKVLVLLSIVFIVAIVFTSCKAEKKEDKKEQVTSSEKEVAFKEVYQCPMECEKDKTYDKEGKCPVCKMNLKKKSKEKSTESHEGHQH